MEAFFSPAGEAALTYLMRQNPLLVFDFDGTLAPIVARPEDAHIPPSVTAVLQELSQCLPIAIVSGRPISSVEERLKFKPWRIVGNHGAEDVAEVQANDNYAQALDDVRNRLMQIQQRLTSLGIDVEDKGQSIALHYRLSRTPDFARAFLEALSIELEQEYKIFGGKKVINITPKNTPDKADAIFRLLEQSEASVAFFAGDDVNDEPAFTRAPTNWMTLRIGLENLDSDAQFFVPKQEDILKVLMRMRAIVHSNATLILKHKIHSSA